MGQSRVRQLAPNLVVALSSAFLIPSSLAVTPPVAFWKKSATIVANGAGRRWSDGSFAVSCNGYRHPTGNRLYSGLTGDGTYTVDPDGTGPIAPFDVSCDMTTNGGGWTQIPLTALTVDQQNFSNDNKGAWNSSTYVWSCTGGPSGVEYYASSLISLKITNGITSRKEMRVQGKILGSPSGFGWFGGISFDKQTATTRNDYIFRMDTNGLQGTYASSTLYTAPGHNFYSGGTTQFSGQPFGPSASGTSLSITRLSNGTIIGERTGTFYTVGTEPAPLFSETQSTAGNTELRVLLGLQCVSATSAGPDYPSVQLTGLYVRE